MILSLFIISIIGLYWCLTNTNKDLWVDTLNELKPTLSSRKGR